MSIECGYCEQDLRGGHAKNCPRRRTPKMRVLKKHPLAFCWWRSLYGEWQVFERPDGRLIGIGNSPKQAWAQAASDLF